MKKAERVAAINGIDASIRHLPEPAMRRAVLREAFLALEPLEACHWLGAILERPAPPASSFDLLRDSLFELLHADASEATGELDYEWKRAVYEAAREHGHELVAKTLRSLPALRELESPTSLLAPELSDVPLGRRRSLAKTADLDLLKKLALDADPIVLRNLLQNPRVTEREVLRIASLCPVPATTLIEVHRSPRWNATTRVRTALVHNPYCPTEIAVQAVHTLPLAELREVRGDPRVHADVRQAAADEMTRREAR